ncbi:FtsK/SpoIIIE domain-containing protein [Gammaproteobacteria bacterium]|nr:FtsK/SpoIIIE domain-containing protein [Gammaproteobacteria bacterium]
MNAFIANILLLFLNLILAVSFFELGDGAFLLSAINRISLLLIGHANMALLILTSIGSFQYIFRKRFKIKSYLAESSILVATIASLQSWGLIGDFVDSLVQALVGPFFAHIIYGTLIFIISARVLNLDKSILGLFFKFPAYAATLVKAWLIKIKKPTITSHDPVDRSAGDESVTLDANKKNESSFRADIENEEAHSNLLNFNTDFIEYKSPNLEILDDNIAAPNSDDSDASNLSATRDAVESVLGLTIQDIVLGPQATTFYLESRHPIDSGQLYQLASVLGIGENGIKDLGLIAGRRNVVGVELRNLSRKFVPLKTSLMELMKVPAEDSSLKICLGTSELNVPIIEDLIELPHLWIAGTNGSGKTIALEAIISSLISLHSPGTLNLVLMSTKPDFNKFASLPHLPKLKDPIVDDQVMTVLNKIDNENIRRKNIIETSNSRDFKHHNLSNPDSAIPHLVIIIDEYYQLKTRNKAFEEKIKKLTSEVRAQGIYFIIAVQKPTKVQIETAVSSQLQGRLCFQIGGIANATAMFDYDVGTSDLLGKGDGYFVGGSQHEPIRVQSPFSEEGPMQEFIQSIRLT